MSDSANREVELFSEASQLPAEERSSYLERACGGDAALRRRIEALLQTHFRVGDFLEIPPGQAAGGIRPAPATGEKPGDRIGRYKLLQQIGEGGCGVVYMAQQDEPVRRRVALKVIKLGMDTKQVVARFEAERQALAMMDHPNIAKVLDAGATDAGRPYFVMELVRGVKITEYCDQAALTTEERLRLFIQVCHAIQHAHQKGIIHRDIKPSNILVTNTMEAAALPVVIDFGIAKATTNLQLTNKTLFTAFEMLIGTPAYMSPEQAALTNVDIDTRTDIYSLGVLLYELLTGSTPFDTTELLKSGLDEVRRVIREKEPARPSTRLSKMTGHDLTTVALRRNCEAPRLIRTIRGDLDWIAMKAMDKFRARRYETAAGLALDVERFLANEPIVARSPSAIYQFRKLVSRNKVLFSGLAAAGLLLVISLVTVSAALAKERQAHREAEADKTKAEAEAVKSRQVTQFLTDMLQGVGPSVARGRDTTMLREILDRTAERTGKELTGQPLVEAELRGVIGGVYQQLGNYEQAEKMQRSALELNRKLFGAGSPEAAASQDDLGLALSKEGKLAESEDAFQEALVIRRHLFGNTNRDVADSLNNLATVYRHQQRLQESEALIREALEIRRTLFGGESLEVADSLHNLCVILGDEGRRSESEATARELLALRRRLLGNDDPLVAAALDDVAWSAGMTGKSDEAEVLQGDALAIQRKRLGDEHPDVARSLFLVGESMAQHGKFSEADAMLSAALSIQCKVLGEDNPATLYTLRSLAWTLESEGKWPEAELAHRQGMTAWRKREGIEGPEALAELTGLARTLMARKNFGEAEQMLDSLLTPAFAAQPSSAPLLALRLDLLGQQGRWQEAAADAALVLQYMPGDNYRYHQLAALLVMAHNQPAYEEVCRRFLARFANTSDPYAAERMAKDCLLVPNWGVNLQLVDKLADQAVTAGTGDVSGMPYFQTAKAQSSYRLGRFDEAIEWARKPLTGPQLYARADACAILAMAHWQLGEKAEARAALADGNSLAPRVQPGTKVDLGAAWVARLFARISLDEAEGMIQPAAALEENPNKTP